MNFKLMILALFNAAMAFNFGQPRERLFTRGGSVFSRINGTTIFPTAKIRAVFFGIGRIKDPKINRKLQKEYQFRVFEPF